MTAALALVAIALAAMSGGVAVVLRRRPERAHRAACLTLCAGALCGIACAVGVLSTGTVELHLGSLPLGAAGIRVDALSALFLLPVFGVPAAGAIYGLAYYPQERGARAIRLQIFYGLVTASMALLVVASNAILFLVGWEIMALCGFLLVLTEHEQREAQNAAFVYLAAAHVATLSLFALFSVLASQAGSFEFTRMATAGLSPGLGVFVLLVGGFGLKAGLMPLHFWLPGAHAAAPSHVSAILSGVLLKTGIYGLLRVTGLFAAPPLWWGIGFVTLGAISSVLGVAFALAQHDLKRLLAYHSVENIGIIVMGLGLALVGRTIGSLPLVVLGFSGAVLHVINHALFKALLFLGAGAVVHASGTRDIDRLGALSRAMPRTALLFLVGAVAISGLPPLNGFVSEWLVYAGALRGLRATGTAGALVVLVVPVLALVGGLAAACFAKVYGTVFLGTARTDQTAGAHEPSRAMLAPMTALALACGAIGLFPAALLPALGSGAAEWVHVPGRAVASALRAPLAWAATLSVAAAALVLLTVAIASWRGRRVVATESETWGCGFARPTARMQYTGSSFAEMLILRFGWALFPRARVRPPRGPFPRRASFESHVPDTVLDAALVPVLRRGAWGAEWARRFQQGQVQRQALLVALALLTLLGWRFIWW